MTTYVLDTNSDSAAYVEKLQLEGNIYEFRIRFNTRANSWMVDIFDLGGKPVVSGRKAVLNSNQLAPFQHKTNVPPGSLTFFDTTSRQEPATRTDLGTRVLYLYTDSADIEALSDEDIQEILGG